MDFVCNIATDYGANVKELRKLPVRNSFVLIMAQNITNFNKEVNKEKR